MPNVLNLDNLPGLVLTQEQGKWRRVAERVAKDVLAPNAERVDREGSFPRENIRALGESGLLGLLVPTEMGGPGCKMVTATLVTETLAKTCASTAMCYHMHQATVPIVCSLAEGPQVEKFVAPLLETGEFWAFAMSEPGSGNRIWHMDSYAEPDGDGFIIDSYKSFATSSGYADKYLVPVRGSADVGPSDLSLFVIQGSDPRVEPKGTWDGMGLRGNCSRPVHFNRCRVPSMNRLGDATAGFSFMMAYSLPIYLVGLSACYLGIAEAAFDAALAHVKRRIHSDTKKPLATVETVQRYIAEMKYRIDQARATIYRVAQMSDNATALFDEFVVAGILDEVIRENPDDPYFVDLADVKIIACETASTVTHMALQVCGGGGYKKGHIAERCYRDARAGSLMGPSDDTLKIIIGHQLLGIPQPWA